MDYLKGTSKNCENMQLFKQNSDDKTNHPITSEKIMNSKNWQFEMKPMKDRNLSLLSVDSINSTI